MDAEHFTYWNDKGTSYTVLRNNPANKDIMNWYINQQAKGGTNGFLLKLVVDASKLMTSAADAVSFKYITTGVDANWYDLSKVFAVTSDTFYYPLCRRWNNLEWISIYRYTPANGLYGDWADFKQA